MIQKITLILAVFAVAGCSRDEPKTYEVPREGAPAAPTSEHAHAQQPPASMAGQTELPPGHPDISQMGNMNMADIPVATAVGTGIQWELPEGWSAGRASSMRVGSFRATGEAGEADISVTTFPGDVGGVLGNINRWRGQVGLGPVSADVVEQFYTPVTVDGLSGYLVEAVASQTASGAAHPAALLSVGVEREGQSWFFKMTGPAPLVAAEKEHFLQFVGSVRFED